MNLFGFNVDGARWIEANRVSSCQRSASHILRGSVSVELSVAPILERAMWRPEWPCTLDVQLGKIHWVVREEPGGSMSRHELFLDGRYTQEVIVYRSFGRSLIRCRRLSSGLDPLLNDAWLFFEMFNINACWTLIDLGAPDKIAIWGVPGNLSECYFSGTSVSDPVQARGEFERNLCRLILQQGSRPFWSERRSIQQLEWAQACEVW